MSMIIEKIKEILDDADIDINPLKGEATMRKIINCSSEDHCIETLKRFDRYEIITVLISVIQMTEKINLPSEFSGLNILETLANNEPTPENFHEVLGKLIFKLTDGMDRKPMLM